VNEHVGIRSIEMQGVREVLLQTPSERTRRRFRGNRRHFAKVERTVECIDVNADPDNWFDFRHWHLDWKGRGERSWRMRLAYLDALVRMHSVIARRLAHFARPFHLWIGLDGGSASQDALLVHSPNSNGTPFPLRFERIEWGDERLVPVFERWTPGAQWRVGALPVVTDADDDSPCASTSWIAYRTDVGVPLEA